MRVKVRDWNLVRNILAGARKFRNKPVKGGDTNPIKDYQDEIEEVLEPPEEEDK